MFEKREKELKMLVAQTHLWDLYFWPINVS